MGNSESTLEREMKQWHYEFDAVDPCFGMIRVYSKGDEQICLVSKTTNQASVAKNKLPEFNHPHILKMHYQRIQKQQEYCSQFNCITMAYEYVTNNLLRVISQRKEQAKGFLEPQIWCLLQQTSSALCCLLEHGIYHLDLIPSSVLLNKLECVNNGRQGQVKILDRSFTNNQVSGLTQVVLGIREDLHLSPEEVRYLHEKRSDHRNLDRAKCDIFQLGLTCLYAVTLQPIQSLYFEDSQEFDYFELGDRLSSVERLYSTELVNTLKMMLNQDPTQRPTSKELLTQIDTKFGTLKVDITNSDTFVTLPRKSQESSMLTPTKSDFDNIWFAQRSIQIATVPSDKKIILQPAQDIAPTAPLAVTRRYSNHSVPPRKVILTDRNNAASESEIPTPQLQCLITENDDTKPMFQTFLPQPPHNLTQINLKDNEQGNQHNQPSNSYNNNRETPSSNQKPASNQLLHSNQKTGSNPTQNENQKLVNNQLLNNNQKIVGNQTPNGNQLILPNQAPIGNQQLLSNQPPNGNQLLRSNQSPNGNQLQLSNQPLNGTQKIVSNQPLNGHSQPLNGLNQPLNGYTPPLNGQNSSLNGYTPPLNGQNQPLNGYTPPLNGQNPPLSGQNPPINGYTPPLNGQNQPLNGQNLNFQPSISNQRLLSPNLSSQSDKISTYPGGNPLLSRKKDVSQQPTTIKPLEQPNLQPQYSTSNLNSFKLGPPSPLMNRQKESPISNYPVYYQDPPKNRIVSSYPSNVLNTSVGQTALKFDTKIDDKINQALMRSNQVTQKFSTQEFPPQSVTSSVRSNTSQTQKVQQWPMSDDYISTIIKQAQIEIERSKTASKQVKI